MPAANAALAAPVPGYLGCQLSTGGDVQLGEHVREMRLHGPARHVQPVADLRILARWAEANGEAILDAQDRCQPA